MRMQTETALHPIAPVAEIPADLTELRPGQAFSARIQEVLPENTYKALVAGRSLTLALPEGAKAGDTLELVVIDRTPRLIVAQLANRGGPGDLAAASYEFTSLSPAARLIGALLARDGSAPPAAPLTRGRHCSLPLPPIPPAWPPILRQNWPRPSARADCSTKPTRCSGSWAGARWATCWSSRRRDIRQPKAQRRPAMKAALPLPAQPRAGGPPNCPGRWCSCKTCSAAMKRASRPALSQRQRPIRPRRCPKICGRWCSNNWTLRQRSAWPGTGSLAGSVAGLADRAG